MSTQVTKVWLRPSAALPTDEIAGVARIHGHRLTLAVLSAICLLCVFGVAANAASLTPESVVLDVTDLVSGPTADYKGSQIFIMGKDVDAPSGLEYAYVNQRYLVVQLGMTFGKNYSGPSNYLVVTLCANGLGQLESYLQGYMTLMIDESPFEIAMPAFTFTNATQYLSLYVADDGSTFYACSDHLPASGSRVGDILDASADLSPSQAFVPEHLAAEIPEPSTLALLGLGGLALRRRRKS